MMTTNNNRQTAERTAELYAIREEISKGIIRTSDIHNENVANGIHEWETDELLDQFEALFAEVNELLAA